MATRGTALMVEYYAWDTDAKAFKTGDVANHTLRVIKDGTSAAPTNSPAEVDSTNCPGLYRLLLTTTECTADCVMVAGKSSTANVVILGSSYTFESTNINTILSILQSGDLEITIVSPHIDDDGVIQGIIVGNDLKAADGRAITVDFPLALADLTGATNVVMQIQTRTNGLLTGSVESVAYVINSAGTASQSVSFDFSRTTTINLVPEMSDVEVEATLLSGTKASMKLKADILRAVQ